MLVVILRKLLLPQWYCDVSNLLSTTARVCRDGGGENDLDDVHLLVGEEMQWRISLAVT